MSESRDSRIMKPSFYSNQKPVWTVKYLAEKGIDHKEFCNEHGKEQVYADLAVMTVEEFETKYGLR